MSVGSVSGTAQRWDLVGALRQARPVSTAGAFGTDIAGAASGQTTATSGSGSAPPLSRDLMASLLQIQADASQGGTAGGKTATGTDAAQAGPSGAGRAHHAHRHHAVAAPDGPATAQPDGSAATAAAAATAPADAAGDVGSFLQQVAKAAAAYATGGPLGLATSALTTPAT